MTSTHEASVMRIERIPCRGGSMVMRNGVKKQTGMSKQDENMRRI